MHAAAHQHRPRAGLAQPRRQAPRLGVGVGVAAQPDDLRREGQNLFDAGRDIGVHVEYLDLMPLLFQNGGYIKDAEGRHDVVALGDLHVDQADAHAAAPWIPYPRATMRRRCPRHALISSPIFPIVCTP